MNVNMCKICKKKKYNRVLNFYSHLATLFFKIEHFERFCYADVFHFVALFYQKGSWFPERMNVKLRGGNGILGTRKIWLSPVVNNCNNYGNEAWKNYLFLSISKK